MLDQKTETDPYLSTYTSNSFQTFYENMKKQGVSQRKLGKMIGTSQATVSKLLRAKQKVPLTGAMKKAADKWAELMKISLENRYIYRPSKIPEPSVTEVKKTKEDQAASYFALIEGLTVGFDIELWDRVTCIINEILLEGRKHVIKNIGKDGGSPVDDRRKENHSGKTGPPGRRKKAPRRREESPGQRVDRQGQ